MYIYIYCGIILQNELELCMSKQYLFRIEILSKKDKHPLESIAYYSGEKQFDILNGKNYETTTNDKVVWSKIIIPEKSLQNGQFFQLPDYLKFRSQKPDLISNARNILWKSVSERENRPDSQFARLFELAIPYFLTKEEAVILLNNFSKTLVAEGMIVDGALHSYNKQTPILSIFEKMKLIQAKEKDNESSEKLQDYTGFLMCTLRDYKSGRFVNKNREWNNPLKLKQWRGIWVELLSTAIMNSKEGLPEEKQSWNNKLNIYPEFKQQHNSSNNSVKVAV